MLLPAVFVASVPPPCDSDPVGHDPHVDDSGEPALLGQVLRTVGAPVYHSVVQRGQEPHLETWGFQNFRANIHQVQALLI